jgi:glutamate--cysteine ligase
VSTLPKTGPSPEVTSVAQCVAWVTSAATAPERRAVGVEYERLAIGPDGRLLPYDGPVSIRALFDGLADRYGWTRIMERGCPIALTREGRGISLEGAGQLEFSGAPHTTVTAMRAELLRHRAELADVGTGLGVRFVWTGYNPSDHLPDTPFMPRERFELMRQIFPTRGTMGIAMLDFTCAVQVNLDFTDSANCVEMVRLGHLLTPVLIALFANSPLAHGGPAGQRSYRASIWPDVDPTRCGAPPLVFERGTTVDDLVEWAWDVPLYLLPESRPDGVPGYVPLDRRLTFRQLVAEGYHGRRATIADWEVHLSATYPDMRMRRQLELRQCDVVPPEALPALPALAKGLFYDADARRRSLALFGDGDARIDRGALRSAACRDALDAQVGDVRLRDLARETLAIARAGLASLERAAADPDAAAALDVLDAIVAGERPPFWQHLVARWAAAPCLAGISDPA